MKTLILNSCLAFAIFVGSAFAAPAQGAGAGGNPVDLGLQAFAAEVNVSSVRSAFQRFLSLSHGKAFREEDARLDPGWLKDHRVFYDPTSPDTVGVGVSVYQLAPALKLLRETDYGQGARLADLIEMRLVWQSGNVAGAYDRVKRLIEETAKAGISDPQTASVLADAAVLALRLGDSEAAERYFERARSCLGADCPKDEFGLFRSAPPKDRAGDAAPIAPEIRRRRAMAAAGTLFPGDAGIIAEIERAALFASDAAVDLVSGLIRDIDNLEQGAALPEEKRTLAREAAFRMMSRAGMETHMLLTKRTAAVIRSANPRAGGWTPEALAEIEHLDPESIFSDSMYRALPVVIRLLGRSDGRGDALVARHLSLQFLLRSGEYQRAAGELAGLVASARTAGFNDRELHSLLMDLWAAAVLIGDVERAADLEAATAECRLNACREDLLNVFLTRANVLPSIRGYGVLDEVIRGVAEDFIRTTFPGDMLKLADLYYTGVGGAQRRPMDAARLDKLSIGFAESAPDIDPKDLATRAAKVMDTLVYAGQYRDAAIIGDRIKARIDGEGRADVLTERFYRVRARAAFRLGAGNARDFYAAAVDLVIAGRAPADGWQVPDALMLDLQDTPYLDLLDRLLAGGGSRAVLARLRARQGRYGDAADMTAERRRQIEVRIGKDWFFRFFTGLAEAREKAGDNEAAVGLALRADAAARGVDIPKDHPEFYVGNILMRIFAYQEAVYRQAAAQTGRAAALMKLAGSPPVWTPLDQGPDEAKTVELGTGGFGKKSSYDHIRDVIELRDHGDWDAAAFAMRHYRWLAVAAEANGAYVDAQALWQMAFTFVRVGDTNLAFDLMDRAARIAARLSFEGAGGADGGTLQLLERDRWRYLLFVDIAWAALSGTAPRDMTVVSRY